jgi:hypothetical protein
MGKYTIRYGVDVAREYASVKALRALFDTPTAISYMMPRAGESPSVEEWYGDYEWDKGYRYRKVARDLRSASLLAFTIIIPEAQNG